MAKTTTETVFVIKNQNGEFLEFQTYNGLRTWTSEFNDRCTFASQNAATLYCRNLIADAQLHGVDMEFDVFKHNNQIVELDVTIPDNQRVSYGLPEKVAEPTVETEG